MKMFVVGDEDTVLGFRYSGIDGRAVRSPQEAIDVIEGFVAEDAQVLIVIPEQMAVSVRERINEIRFEREFPLIVEVPGLSGPSRDRPSLAKVIQQAVGIHI